MATKLPSSHIAQTGTATSASSTLTSFISGVPFVAWGVIIIGLASLATFQSTEQLAAMFAYLILVAVIFANYSDVTAWIRGNATKTANPQGA